MGSASILVIGDNWRDQLNRLQTLEYADPLNRHIVHIDHLDEARLLYPNATTCLFRLMDDREIENWDEIDDELKQDGGVSMYIVHKPLNGAIPFVEWVASEYGLIKLEPGAEPDFLGRHKMGWMRLNEAGEVTELVERTIPGAFFYYFTGTSDAFLLKPGAIGWDIYESEILEINSGYVSSARFSDIDFGTMRQKKVNDIEKRWDKVHHAASGNTWIPFTEIRKKYPQQTEQYSHEIEDSANREWFNQPTLQKIYQAHCTNDYRHEAIDLMLLPRTDYIQLCTKNLRILNYNAVIQDYENLCNLNEADLLAGLDNDVLMTMATVKC